MNTNRHGYGAVARIIVGSFIGIYPCSSVIKKISFGCLISLFAIVFTANAQSPNVRAKGINVPYFEGTHLKALFTGKEARPITGGKGELFVTDFEMRQFGKTTNEIELVVRAPECFFNHMDKRAWSTNRLEVFSGTTNFFIEGAGFICHQTTTNTSLIISNDVHTILQRDAETNKQTSVPLHVYSEHFNFLALKQGDTETRTATYTGNVRVDDPDLELHSEFLRADLPTGTNRVRKIVAETNVVIISKQDNGRATGTTAVYNSEHGAGVVTLFGNPTWRDAERQGKAEIFVFNRDNKTIRAEKDAVMKVPRQAFALQPGLMSGTTTTGEANAQDSFVEIAADVLNIQLPETNGPIRTLAAEGNVVINSPKDQSRTTSRKALYNETSGVLELFGDPIWQIGESELRGDTITVVRTNRAISARNNVTVKLPASAMAGPQASPPGRMQINAQEFDLVNNVAFFRRDVHAAFPTATNANATLDSALLTVHFNTSNQVEKIIAEKNVNVIEITQSPTNTLHRHVQCEDLVVDRNPVTTLLTKISAKRNVYGTEIEKTAATKKVTSFSAADVQIGFFPHTNAVQTFTANGDVMFDREKTHVTGQHVVYAAENEYVEITGEPVARTEKFLWDKSQVLRWFPKTGKVWSRNHIVTPIDTNNTVNAISEKLQ